MEIVFLGTRAADLDPAEIERQAGAAFSRDVRRNAAALIDGHVLIDCGPGVPGALSILGVALQTVTDLLVTHTHRDHILPESVALIADARKKTGLPPLTVWCEGGAAFRFADIGGVRVNTLTPLSPVAIGKLTVTPLPSNHRVEDSPENTLHHYLEEDGRTLFYGLDGGWLTTREYDFLCGKHTDVFVFDGTVGDYIGDQRMGSHNSVPMIRMMLASLRNEGAFAEDGLILLSHIAPVLYGGMDHEQTDRLLQKDGLHAAYDGMTVRL